MHNIIFLKDLDGTALDPYVRLNEAQLFHAMKPGMFIAESPKVMSRVSPGFSSDGRENVRT